MKSVVGMQGYKGRILQKNFDGHMKKVREALDKVVLHAGKKWYDTPEKIAEKMYRILDKYLGVKKYFRCEIGKDKPTFKYTALEDAIKQDEKLDGLFCILTNKKISALQALAEYKEKPCVDVLMHVLKNAMEVGPVFLKNDKRIKGMAIVWYLALLVRSLIEYEVNENISRDMQKMGEKSNVECVRKAFRARKKHDYRITFETMRDIFSSSSIVIEAKQRESSVIISNVTELGKKMLRVLGLDCNRIQKMISRSHCVSPPIRP